jgi:hypothetical protein
MNTRIALYALADKYRLDAAAVRSLFSAAGFNQEPDDLRLWFFRGAAVLAAALGGLGVIFWLAANWDTLGRTGRFALLQGVVLVMGVGAGLRPKLRAPLGLLALLCTGGLFAYFGQTYQTGADAWQLFALWAVLGLFLGLGARSDVLWAPWALVALTAVSLWTFAHTGHRWRVESQDLATYAIAWAAAICVVVLVSPLFARWTGAGVWALRAAATFTVITITLAAIAGLFNKPIAPHFLLALLLFALAAMVLAQRAVFEIFVLSAVALGLNSMLVAGFVRWLFDGNSGDLIGKLLFTGLVAAGLLAASVSTINRLARQHQIEAKP